MIDSAFNADQTLALEAIRSARSALERDPARRFALYVLVWTQSWRVSMGWVDDRAARRRMAEPLAIALIAATFLFAGAVDVVIGIGLPTMSPSLLTAALDLRTGKAAPFQLSTRPAIVR